jgi:cell division protein FtsB
MKKTNIRKIYYHVRYRYLTMNNVVIAIALTIGAGWAWGSVEMMQRNFTLQKDVDGKARQLQLVDLQTQNLAYEQRYYESAEYQELAIRARLGLAKPGEKAIILPPNSDVAKKADTLLTQRAVQATEPVDNVQQWMNFLFGGNRRE